MAQKIQFDMYSSRDTGEHVFTIHQGGLTEEEMRLILNEMGVSEPLFALLAGILGGLFSSPCATPVLMLCYSMGHSALIIFAGTSLGFVQKINASEKYNRFSTILKIIWELHSICFI